MTKRGAPDGDGEAHMALAMRCVESFESVGYGKLGGNVAGVSSRTIQGLWAGTGSVIELTVKSDEGDKKQIIAKLIGPPDDANDYEGKRDHDSFYVEASFYEQGHAARVQKAGATVPQGLFIDRLDGGNVHICMTKLTGRSMSLDEARTKTALQWLARLHALYWGEKRAAAAVEEGLQAQGCYWHFDTRQLEFNQMPTKGWQGRLRMAAAGLDARLKADSMQTVCHGDAKGANIFFDSDDSAQFFDFQWIGKAPPAKDLAYFMSCAASSSDDEEGLRFYQAELSALLAAQGDEAPTFEKLWASYVLSVADLGRWMAGWGWWGNVRRLQGHAKALLDQLDGGEMLDSEEAYKTKIFSLFPP